MAIPAVKSAIASQSDKCSALFHELADTVQNALPDSANRDQITEAFVQDELGRFRVWLGNVGAHRSGRVSLDYRLREATSLRDSVLELLKDLGDNLQEAFEAVSGQRLPYDESISDSSSSESEVDEEPLDEKRATELEQSARDIHDIITCLYEISIVLRDPTPRDRLLKLAAIDVSYFEQWDKMHIEHKFPKAHPILIERLARANSKRRQYFKYLEKHHDKLALGSHADLVREEPPKTMKVPIISRGNRSDQPVVETSLGNITVSTPTTINTKNTQTTVATFRLDEDVYIDNTLSETSSAASEGVSEATHLEIPTPPQAAVNGDPFECPYCFEMMKISGLLAWRMHVLRDLQPYICTFMGCTQPQKNYGSRHEWFLHEAQHRKRWSCIYCRQTFSSESEFSSHIKEDHATDYAPNQLQALIDMCLRPVDSYLLGQCPLCLQEGQQLRSHLAQHLRTLALFVLPKSIDVDREDVNSEAVQSGGSEEHEDTNANLDALSISDQMSDISEDAKIEVSKTKYQAEEPMKFDQVEEKLNSSLTSRSETASQDLLKLKLGPLDSGAQAFHIPKPLPIFLQGSKTEIKQRFDDLLERERQRIEYGQPGYSFHSALQTQHIVQQRNQYSNSYPWDNNRVRLEVPMGSCDYINASPISLRSSRTGKVRKYIANQGPKSASHFWRMVWQETQGTAILIMLTQAIENGRVMSSEYFPPNPDIPIASYVDDESGDGMTAIVSDRRVYSSEPQAVFSTMQLSVIQNNETQPGPSEWQANELGWAIPSKEVLHYQFIGWPESNMPEGDDRYALINLSKVSRLAELERDCSPRIVCCSAGSPRTETFIALDFLLGEIEDGGMEDRDIQTDMIYETVDSLRMQRRWDVQDLRSYEFLYETLKEEMANKMALQMHKSSRATWSRGPISASVRGVDHENEVIWIDCTSADGIYCYISRTLGQLRSLQISLESQFPKEDYLRRTRRLLLDLEKALEQQRRSPNLKFLADSYIQKLIYSPPKLATSTEYLGFFTPWQHDLEPFQSDIPGEEPIVLSKAKGEDEVSQDRKW